MGQARGHGTGRSAGEQRSIDRSVVDRLPKLASVGCSRLRVIRRTRSFDRFTELAQGPVYPAFNGRDPPSGELDDLPNGQVGAKAQGDHLALRRAKRHQVAADEGAVWDRLY